jgi:hypothetical protein
LVDALGNPLKIILTAGQVHDLAGADAFLPDMEATILLAERYLPRIRKVASWLESEFRVER